jgi:protein gp37
MKPAFHPKRLNQPLSVKKPSFIFTGSSGDMWGNWVNPDWIDDVLDVCGAVAPYHTYQFLTKNPKRYKDFTLPDNCWAGTTIDGTERTEQNDLILYESTQPDTFRFISFEPLLAMPQYVDWDSLDWVIIGANSNKSAEKPPIEWATVLINEASRRSIPVWVKDNYGYPERIKDPGLII